MGLGRSPQLGIPGEEQVLDGLVYVEGSKVADVPLVIGKHVAVVGAGNTAIDCATIAKRLGAERVTIVYRRGEKEMTAYPHEVQFALKEGIEFRFLAQPVEATVETGTCGGTSMWSLARQILQDEQCRRQFQAANSLSKRIRL